MQRQVNTNVHACCVNRRQPSRQVEAVIVVVYTFTTFQTPPSLVYSRGLFFIALANCLQCAQITASTVTLLWCPRPTLERQWMMQHLWNYFHITMMHSELRPGNYSLAHCRLPFFVECGWRTANSGKVPVWFAFRALTAVSSASFKTACYLASSVIMFTGMRGSV